MSVQVAVAAVVVVLTLILYKLFVASPVSKSFASMPGPPQPLGPFIGSFPNQPYLQQHLHFIDLSQRYGQIVRKRVLGNNVVVLTDPAIAKKVTDDKEAFPERPLNGIHYYFPLGLLALPTGQMWKDHRVQVSKIFADKFIRQYTDVFVSKSLILVDQLNKLSPTESTNIHLGVSKLSLDAIGISGFGYDFHVLDQNHGQYYQAANHMNLGAIMRTLLPIPLLYRALQHDNYTKGQKGLELFRELVIKMRNSRQSTEARTLIDILNDAGLPENEIVDEILTMVLAGHETTANTISWAISLLALNPDKQRKAQAEIDEIWQRPGFDLHTGFFELKSSLPYIRAVFDEALRIYPTVPQLPRSCVKDTQIGPYDVPAGTIVYIANAALGRDERNFENADKFIPERFLDRDNEEKDKPRYFPFGGGIRVCVGRRFAEMEGITVLAILLHNFDFELDTSKPIVEESHITLTSQSGIWVRVKKRTHEYE